MSDAFERAKESCGCGGVRGLWRWGDEQRLSRHRGNNTKKREEEEEERKKREKGIEPKRLFSDSAFLEKSLRYGKEQ